MRCVNLQGTSLDLERTLLFEQEKKSTYIFLKPTIFMDKHILKYHHTDHLSPL